MTVFVQLGFEPPNCNTGIALINSEEPEISKSSAYLRDLIYVNSSIVAHIVVKSISKIGDDHIFESVRIIFVDFKGGGVPGRYRIIPHNGSEKYALERSEHRPGFHRQDKHLH